MRKIVVGNLKMNLISSKDSDQYITSFKREIKGKKIDNVDIVVCPPYLYLENFSKELDKKKISIGAQNFFWEEKGSFTGEISAKMIKDLGIEYSIVGHSERRKYFNETNETANLKINVAIKNGITPVYCIGETEEERKMGNTAQIIKLQIVQGLKDLSQLSASRIVIAYEPVWAVGSDRVPTSNEILEAKILMKKILSEMFGRETAEKIKLLYGGSVKSNLVDQVCIQPDMDGVLVGRESLLPSEFLKIVEIIDNC